MVELKEQKHIQDLSQSANKKKQTKDDQAQMIH